MSININNNNNNEEGVVQFKARMKEWKSELMSKNKELAELKSDIAKINSKISELQNADIDENNNKNEQQKKKSSKNKLSKTKLTEIEEQEAILATERLRINLLKDINIKRNNFVICGKYPSGNGGEGGKERRAQRIDNLIACLLNATTHRYSRLAGLDPSPDVQDVDSFAILQSESSNFSQVF